MKRILTILIVIFVYSSILCQSKYEKNYAKEELITISRDIKIPEALKTLEIMSQQFEGNKIINMSTLTDPIGIPIKEIYWKDALELIISYNDLALEEMPGVYIIKDIIVEEVLPDELVIITSDTKQIKISAIFFKADKTLLNSIGIDWSTLFNGEVVASVNFQGASRVSEDIFQSAVATHLDAGTVTIDINTLFRIIEANRKGTIIAHPTITVISGRKGFIQVGEDFSIKTADESGNITEEFFETGIILEVTPTIISNEEGDNEAIHLEAKIEKSAASPGEITTIIHKSTSDTEVLLFDGEETVIGGLYDTEVTKERTGIPILKDLPWWMLGIRYLTGYNKYETIEREMIVILKAEIIKPIEQRREELLSTRAKIQKLRETNEYLDSLFSYNKIDIESQLPRNELENKITELPSKIQPETIIEKPIEPEIYEEDITENSIIETYNKIVAIYFAGNFQEAYEKFNNFIKKYPTHKLSPRAYYLTGECLYEMGNIVEAKMIFENTIKQKGLKMPDALMMMGNVYQKGNDFDSAIYYWKHLINEFPDNKLSEIAQYKIHILENR